MVPEKSYKWTGYIAITLIMEELLKKITYTWRNKQYMRNAYRNDHEYNIPTSVTFNLSSHHVQHHKRVTWFFVSLNMANRPLFVLHVSFVLNTYVRVSIKLEFTP